MGYSEKYRKKLEDIINTGKTKEERVKLSFKAGYTVLTKPSGDVIRESYEKIEDAINNLDSKDPKMGEKKHNLQQLKKQVPFLTKIPNKLKQEVQETINDILGKNSSNE